MPSKVFPAAVASLMLKKLGIDVSHGLKHFEIISLLDKANEESTIVIKHPRCS
jgi:hypothetical protein